MKKYIIKISGMHCTSCAMLIEGEAEDLDGVVEASCNYGKSILEIKCEDNFDVNNIIGMIESKGYKGVLYE